MTHFLFGIFSAVPSSVLHAFAFIIGTLSALVIVHLLLVKSSKMVFAKRRSTRFQ